MARQFNGTDQLLRSASNLSLSGVDKITFAMWFWWDTYSEDTDVLVDYGDGGTSQGFAIIPNFSNGTFDGQWYDAGAVNVSHVQFARSNATAGAWHLIVATIDLSLSTHEFSHIYIDNNDIGLTWVNDFNQSGNFANNPLTIFSNNLTLFGAGRGAEVAIWPGLVLSAADVSALWNGGAGVDARNVQGGSLGYYWQLCGTASPEPALVGGINLNVTGATSVAHPISGAGICSAIPAGGYGQIVFPRLRW